MRTHNGPHRTPTKLKALAGTIKPSRVTPDEMEVDSVSEIPEAPKHFDKKAKDTWKLVTNTLYNLDMLHEEDLTQLQAYCMVVSLCERCEIEMSNSPIVTIQTNKAGFEYEAKTKWIDIYNNAIDRLIKLGSQFGFSPSSRTKISMPKSKVDPLDELLKTG